MPMPTMDATLLNYLCGREQNSTVYFIIFVLLNYLCGREPSSRCYRNALILLNYLCGRELCLNAHALCDTLLNYLCGRELESLYPQTPSYQYFEPNINKKPSFLYQSANPWFY